MSRRHAFRPFLCASILTVLPCFSHHGLAANGTWVVNNTGLWSTPGNWLANTVASGIDATADFSTVNITADRTVHLDSARTLGTLTFGDATLASNNWLLDNNGNALNIITLDVTT